MFSMGFGMYTAASACAGASFAAHNSLQDAVLASVFVILAVLVNRIIIVDKKCTGC